MSARCVRLGVVADALEIGSRRVGDLEFGGLVFGQIGLERGGSRTPGAAAGVRQALYGGRLGLRCGFAEVCSEVKAEDVPDRVEFRWRSGVV